MAGGSLCLSLSNKAHLSKADIYTKSFNHVTYPTFKRFLETVGVEYMDSEMSFSVSHEQGQFEWAGGSAGALFGQHINLINPAHWRMIWDIIRFNTEALDSVGESGSIGDYLRKKGYGTGFVDNYLLVRLALPLFCHPPLS